MDLTGVRPLPAGGATVLCDVVNPLTGPDGAAQVFGPQKGASHDDVLLLEKGLTRWSDLVEADPLQPGAGAAGGTGFGLVAWGARLSSGARTVLEVTDLLTVLAAADVVVTGEGQYDDQELERASFVSHVLAAARQRRTDAFLVAGRIARPPTGFAASAELLALAGGVEAAMKRPLHWIAGAGAQLARDFATRAAADRVPS